MSDRLGLYDEWAVYHWLYAARRGIKVPEDKREYLDRIKRLNPEEYDSIQEHAEADADMAMAKTLDKD